MDYKEIVNSILSKLTDNKEENRKYLNSQIEAYRDHRYSSEIIKELGKAMYDNLDEEEQNSFNKSLDEDIKKLDLKLNEAKKLFDEKKYDEVKPILLDYIEAASLVNKEDENQRFFSFRNIKEFFCATSKIKIPQKMVWTSLQFSWAYNILAYIANEEGNHVKAREYCEKAIYYNPLDMSSYFEKAESYKYEHNYEDMMSVVKEIYDYIFNHVELARYYRLLGYYYTEIGKYDISFALYLVSLHFDITDNAYHEIEYIKLQLKNPNYSLTTEKVLELLKQENIPFGLKDENKNILINLTKEKVICEKQPEEIEYVKRELGLLEKHMQVNELLRVNEMPKITADEIFDDKKIILDESDKLRRSKNIELLKVQNIPFIEHMKTMPINSVTSLRTKDEVIKRMIVDYVVATFCTFSLDGKLNDNGLNILNQMDQKLNVKKILVQNDLDFINAIIEKKVPSKQLIDISWIYEECAVLMWALGLIDKPSSSVECDVNKLDEILFNCISYDDLYSKCNLRTKEEILEFADLISRYHWACREMRMKGQTSSQLKEMIVQQQHTGLDWILNWDIKKIMKDNINVNYEKGDFAFRFTTPTTWVIDKLNNATEPNRLLTLKNPNMISAITFFDLGKCKNEEFTEKYKLDLENFKNQGWNVVGEYTLSSNNLKSGVKQLIITLKRKDDPTKLIGLSNYYFILNNHLVSLEILLGENVNYSDNNMIQNDYSNSIGLGILFSIKELGKENINNINDISEDMAKKMNYKLHAEQLSIPLLDGFVERESKEPQTILEATDKDNIFLEQLVTDGVMGQNETIEQRINLIIQSMQNFLQDLSKSNSNKSIFYYKDYTNDVFKYKVYVQDMIVDTQEGQKVYRSFNAYFIEPRFNDFYQLSISSPPFMMPTEKLKLGIVDLENDEVSKELYDMLKILMDNLTYKNFNKKGESEYKEKINMNGIDVHYNKANNDNNLLYADPLELFKADIEGSIIQNLNIKDCSNETAECVKSLYRVILTCGEFENPYVDEFILEEYLKNEQQVIDLVRKFPEVNKIHFNNDLKYLTFSLDDNENLRRYIEILRQSFKNHRKNDEQFKVEHEKVEDIQMDYNEEEIEAVINNEYDYSNILVTQENVSYLVQYYDQVYNQFLKLIEEDEQKNERLKYEFKTYNYKKSYGEWFEIRIRTKGYNIITCKNYTSFIEAVNNGKLKNIASLEIEMNLNYKRGNNDSLKNHENTFKVVFNPYEITFFRKSNYKEQSMDQIENTINEILKKFPVANTIFCYK